MKTERLILHEGKRYYHVSAAARISGVSTKTMWSWAVKNATSFGLELDVVHVAGPKWHNGEVPKKPRDFRALIPQGKVQLIQQLLRDFPLNRHGPLARHELDDLKRATRLHQKCASIALPHP